MGTVIKCYINTATPNITTVCTLFLHEKASVEYRVHRAGLKQRNILLFSLIDTDGGNSTTPSSLDQ